MKEVVVEVADEEVTEVAEEEEEDMEEEGTAEEEEEDMVVAEEDMEEEDMVVEDMMEVSFLIHIYSGAFFVSTLSATIYSPEKLKKGTQLEEPKQPQPFSMHLKLLILYAKAKSYCFTLSCFSESIHRMQIWWAAQLVPGTSHMKARLVSL